MLLDDLLREALVATTDADRAAVASRIARVDDVLAELAARVSSREWEVRRVALHFVTRLAPPPAELASSVILCLRGPLDPDPLGDETALVLVACGLLAAEVSGFRDVVAERVRAIDAAEGERAPAMRRLGHETLKKLDAAQAEAARRRRDQIAVLAALVAAGQRDTVVAAVERAAAGHFYPELGRASMWEDIGHARRSAGDREGARFCLERSLTDYRWHASGASAGGEGMARMLDVNRLERELASLG